MRDIDGTARRCGGGLRVNQPSRLGSWRIRRGYSSPAPGVQALLDR